jgi:hypothetical protein
MADLSAVEAATAAMISMANRSSTLTALTTLLTFAMWLLVCAAVRVTGVRDWRFNQRAEDIEWLLRLSAADGSASTVSWQILYNIASQQQWGELQRFLGPKLAQLRAFCQSQAIQKPGTGERAVRITAAAGVGGNCNGQDLCNSSSGKITSSKISAISAISAIDACRLWCAFTTYSGLLLPVASSRVLCHSLQCLPLLPLRPAESGPLFQPTPHAFKPWRRDFIVDWRHSRARDQVGQQGGSSRVHAGACRQQQIRQGFVIACVTRLVAGVLLSVAAVGMLQASHSALFQCTCSSLLCCRCCCVLLAAAAVPGAAL